MQDDSTIPAGLCQCGCGEKTNLATKTSLKHGRTKGQPQAFLIGHSGHKGPRYLVEDRGHGTPCWVWQWALNQFGYGQAWDRSIGRMIGAHRVFYQAVHGPIPQGLEIDHLCKIRPCVNPDHLEAVTRRENTLRSDCPAALQARQTHCKNGHELAGDNLILRGRHRACRTCKRKYMRDYHRKPNA